MSTPRAVSVPESIQVEPVTTSRGRFAAHRCRPAGAAQGAVLLLPGFTGSKEDFTPLLPLLAGRGWDTVTYDQRGQYETPAALDGDYSLDSFAADARAVADVLGGTEHAVHLVGHSFGGLVAQAAALTSPGRWSSLTLLCSGPGGFAEAGKRHDLEAVVHLLQTRSLDEVHEAIVEGERRRGIAPPEAPIAAFLRARYVANDRDSLVAIAGHLLDAPDRVDAVAALGLPRAVVRGVDDTAWAHDVQTDMAYRLGVEVVLVHGAAHSPAVENPGVLARALGDFFAGCQ